MATVDILLPVKNGVEFLAESLDSVVNQTYKDWRLLILDHGSSDGTVELVAKYRERHPRIELYSFPDAVGLSGLLNRGMELCDCKYLMRQDADDNSFPNRIDVTLDAFKENPGCVAIGGQADRINTAGELTGRISMPVGRSRFAAASLFRSPMLHSSAIMDFGQVQKLGVRYGTDFINVLPENKRISVTSLAEDYFMFGQLGIMGKCTNVPELVMQYRWHSNNVSIRHFAEQMEISLAVSRYLAKSFCEIHKYPYIDPAPFCNHGGMLFNVENETDFAKEFDLMANMLKQVWGDSREIERELTYRKVTATRNKLLLLWRYYQFQSRHIPEIGEWNAVRAWLLRAFPGKGKWKRSKYAIREAMA